MESNKKTYSDKEIYGALKIIRDICKNSGSTCRDCKLSYREKYTILRFKRHTNYMETF